LALYSKYFTTRKTRPHRIVMPMKRRKREKVAPHQRGPGEDHRHARLMRTTVLRVARGTFRYVAPAGHSVAPTRSIT